MTDFILVFFQIISRKNPEDVQEVRSLLHVLRNDNESHVDVRLCKGEGRKGRVSGRWRLKNWVKRCECHAVTGSKSTARWRSWLVSTNSMPRRGLQLFYPCVSFYSFLFFSPEVNKTYRLLQITHTGDSLLLLSYFHLHRVSTYSRFYK